MYEPFCHGQDGFFNTIRKMAQDRREPSAVHVVGNMDWDGLHRPQIYYAMVAIFSGLFLSVIDGTICNVALPTIARQLQISSSDSIWIVNAFQLVVVMTLLPCSALGELFGFKRTYLWGMVFFTVGSLCCALSGSFVCCSFTHVARRGGSHGDEREWLFGTSDLSETPSGQRFRTECHGRGSGLRGRTYDIRCDFIRGLLAMAVCREFAVRRTDILFSP